MLVEHPSLKTLEARRHLLCAEAEVHRAQLVRDLKIIEENARALKNEAVSVGSIISGVVTVVSAFRDMRNSKPREQPSFLSRVIRGARFASTVWQTFRPRER